MILNDLNNIRTNSSKLLATRQIYESSSIIANKPLIEALLSTRSSLLQTLPMSSATVPAATRPRVTSPSSNVHEFLFHHYTPSKYQSCSPAPSRAAKRDNKSQRSSYGQKAINKHRERALSCSVSDPHSLNLPFSVCLSDSSLFRFFIFLT